MILIPWKEGELIRDKQSGKPYSVIHVYKGVCTIMIDSEITERLVPAVILFERDYEYYALDMDMERTKSNGVNHFTHNPIHI